MSKLCNSNSEFEAGFHEFSDSEVPIAHQKEFDTMLAQEIERSRNSINFLSLLMIEIDDFKNFNDTYGPQAGNNCLQQVALALNNTFKRSGDLAIRWGDSKFICQLSDTDSNGAEEMGKKVSKIIKDLEIPNDKYSSMCNVTVSIGGVTSILTEDISSGELLKKLDEALSHAKETRQNQFTICKK